MKGLLVKDYLIISKLVKSYVVLLIVYILLGYFTKNIYMVTGLFVIIPIMLTLNTISYDDYSKYNRLALSSGVSRKDLVLSKYLFMIIITIIVFLISTIVMFTIEMDYALNIFENIRLYAFEVIVTNLVTISFPFIAICLTLPMIFKYGAEKGRIYSSLAFVLPMILIFVLVSIVGFETIENMNVYFMISAVVISMILIITCSIFLSYKVINNKDF